MSLLELTPQFSPDDVIRLAKEQFGLTVDVRRLLPGERDQNFQVTDTEDRDWVLKVCNGGEQAEFLLAQDQLLRHLASRLSGIPQARPTVFDKPLGQIRSQASTHLVRLVEFLPGRPLADLAYRSPELLTDLGRRVAELTSSLADFSSEAFHREFLWDLRTAAAAVRQRLTLVPDSVRPSVDRCLNDYDRHVRPRAAILPQSVIHNDANDGNLIVDSQERIAGLIDFGDAVYSWTIAELAVAIAYAIFHSSDPLQSACAVVRGYVSQRALTDDEIESLFCLIRLRLCLSCVVAAEQSRIRPDDEYLTISQAPLLRVLPQLDAVPHRVATDLLRQAAGLGPQRKVGAALNWLQETQGAAVLRLPQDAELRPVDLSAGSRLLAGSPNTWSCATLQSVIDTFSGDRVVAVGRYMEPRLLYADDHFSTSSTDPADTYAIERRTVHMGIDLFAPATTPVCAVLPGVVERVDHCPEPLDYGTLIILKHESKDGFPIYSLYGHLAADPPVSPGQPVTQGQVIAQLGDADENGGWPPHLHFQLATDLLETTRNFPGVCRASEQTAWAWICPDPSRLLGVEAATYPPLALTQHACRQQRQAAMPASQSTSYQSPLMIVRGAAHHLYSESGHCYLDAYNNVPHAGHCHPRIVDALQSQASVLNTNTRYLHDLRQTFIAELTATFPEPLRVCLLVNSASEANELALRLARAATGGRDLIVLDGAYHGHSTTLIDISPYKHNGPGGAGPPDWVHTAAVADVYRGRYRDVTTAGQQYADEVASVIASLQRDGRTLCGFIAESCPSVGGQILFPPNYLSGVYAAVRAAGGICIADEVQTGYGRLGHFFYGYQQQGVVPDMVVLGKPIGNGHPLAAVITTPQIAAGFDTGMEFFTTFGGNTVSCAVGLEVLRTVQQEGLPERAAQTGDFLLEAFRQLATQFPVIGDVRGSGLFLGLELVRDRQTLEPADKEARFIVERMKDQGILMGTDGPLHNVLKIRPPMTFDHQAAKTLVAALHTAFRQLGN